MTGSDERHGGTSRKLLDRFTVNDWNVAQIIKSGLKNAGYDVETETELVYIVPDHHEKNIEHFGARVIYESEKERYRITITVYRREG